MFYTGINAMLDIWPCILSLSHRRNPFCVRKTTEKIETRINRSEIHTKKRIKSQTQKISHMLERARKSYNWLDKVAPSTP